MVKTNKNLDDLLANSWFIGDDELLIDGKNIADNYSERNRDFSRKILTSTAALLGIIASAFISIPNVYYTKKVVEYTQVEAEQPRDYWQQYKFTQVKAKDKRYDVFRYEIRDGEVKEDIIFAFNYNYPDYKITTTNLVNADGNPVKNFIKGKKIYVKVKNPQTVFTIKGKRKLSITARN